MKKERADVMAVRQGLFPTREKAKRAIMAGLLYDQNSQRIDKPGEKILLTSELQIKGQPLPYVSRGGLKLVKALEVFSLSVQDKILLDIGSSTGGFTDVALQNGAKQSYALDVGYNQLAWKLREDPRVIVMERTNFRYSKLADFTHGQPDIATIDVSFISLGLIFPVLHEILPAGGDVVALIKPQFEAGREAVGKKGIVKNPKTHLAVIEKVKELALASGFDVLGLDFSPITGGEGNIEYLIHLKNTAAAAGRLVMEWAPQKVVEASHAEL
ncbi:MAG: TlyA family RNA methyltransferase [Enterococcaceae bacterium]|jgi:23S rRNA (cytidine1920-2'-O)/16S rRNA (cytidine1409-2'-O)-methyltransferase|nr:TlyA family RNA methyltransferase [Enterococcaceae bacterium]MCI1919124.1 TlyA family RNA methyltransferase [Enterococcaceae bacterium]